MNSGSECINLNGKEYCSEVKQQTISIGGVSLVVKDPEALLRAAKQSKAGFRKTSLYDDYDYVPVVNELAKQNGFEYHEFLTFMTVNWTAKKWNPFKALVELEEIYEELPYIYKGEMFDTIVGHIVEDVEGALYG